ncbi:MULTISPECIES: TetR/AcrR family transcriptional regulator [Halomonadaceae]|uniref:TetR/AcrR family transcriptional regulator n=1 Tax=Halomonadaceae TaxID=28256 RepID=UPI00159B4A6F|nr:MULTISPECIES: TetR/AcrR family transcriptional regulator [Halomonas]QJQ93988.1 TetR/AcrR family transcriptional regulator [Halomonas sp. PA5]
MAMIPVHRSEEEKQGGKCQAKKREHGEQDSELAERIVQTAVEMAEACGWEAVELTEVARRLDMPVAQVLDNFHDLDAVANAWFLRGWQHMLDDKPEGFALWSARERIEHCLMAWFDAFADHRRVTVQMIKAKSHPPHMHTWVPMVFDLSRTIQWLREAARLEAPYGTRRAQLEEIGLTALFLATLKQWADDVSPEQQDTRRFLRRYLKRSERMMDWLWHGHQAR